MRHSQSAKPKDPCARNNARWIDPTSASAALHLVSHRLNPPSHDLMIEVVYHLKEAPFGIAGCVLNWCRNAGIPDHLKSPLEAGPPNHQLQLKPADGFRITAVRLQFRGLAVKGALPLAGDAGRK